MRRKATDPRPTRKMTKRTTTAPTPTTTPTPATPDTDPAPVLERVRRSYLDLLSWSEGRLSALSAGTVEVGPGLLEALVKALKTCSTELPRLESEIQREKDAAAETEAYMVGTEQEEEDEPLTPEEEAEYDAILASSRLGSPTEPQPPPVLTTPKY